MCFVGCVDWMKFMMNVVLDLEFRILLASRSSGRVGVGVRQVVIAFDSVSLVFTAANVYFVSRSIYLRKDNIC